MADFEDEFTCR